MQWSDPGHIDAKPQCAPTAVVPGKREVGTHEQRAQDEEKQGQAHRAPHLCNVVRQRKVGDALSQRAFHQDTQQNDGRVPAEM